MEQVGSANPPLVVHRLYGGCHGQHRRPGIGRTSRLGGLLAATPARLALAHRSVLIRVAACRSLAQRATRRGLNAMAENAAKKSAKAAKKAPDKPVAAQPVLSQAATREGHGAARRTRLCNHYGQGEDAGSAKALAGSKH